MGNAPRPTLFSLSPVIVSDWLPAMMRGLDSLPRSAVRLDAQSAGVPRTAIQARS